MQALVIYLYMTIHTQWKHIWLNGNQICACYKVEDKENKYIQRAVALGN